MRVLEQRLIEQAAVDVERVDGVAGLGAGHPIVRRPAERLDDVARADGPAEAPAGVAEALGQSVDQQHGVLVDILNKGCQVADQLGHTIQTSACDDSELTIRWLEGDINGDCVVDVLDQQNIAFRWGTSKGTLLYQHRMDFQPSGQIKGDGDIDIKDVQFVFGRHGSVCDQFNRFKFTGPTNPPQLPASKHGIFTGGIPTG